MITPELLAEWRRVTEGATPGPWEAREGGTNYGSEADTAWGSVCAPDNGATNWIAKIEDDGPSTEADARFIATARTAMPALLDEVERLTVSRREAVAGYEAEIARLLKLMGEMREELQAERAKVAQARKLIEGYEREGIE